MIQEMIEVELDDTLFHLDVVLPARLSKDQRMQRYISPCLASVVDLLTTRYPTEVRLTMQSKYSDDARYQMRNVAAIYVVGSRSGSHYFLCDCDGERIAVGADHIVSDLASPKQIWPRHNHLSWNSLNGARLAQHAAMNGRED